MSNEGLLCIAVNFILMWGKVFYCDFSYQICSYIAAARI